jgi:hypothetical protein
MIMGSLKVLVAAAFLTLPGEDLGLDDAAAVHAELAPALRVVAIDWQIMDRRETGYVLANAPEFEADLKALQERCHELRTAPPVSEARRFPSREVVGEMKAFNRAYRQRLDARLEWDLVHSEELLAARAEAEQLYRIWDVVEDARTECFNVNARRQALQQLREMVGETAFYTGQLPPHVPVWRFPTID